MPLELPVTASAPVRICDNGGWTDTWFGGPGRILNIAVSPRVEVTLRRATADAPRASGPLVSAALDEFPPPQPVDVQVRSAAPAGSGLGTSAALSVALVAALTSLREEHLGSHRFATLGHHLEADVVGAECGVQDHVSAAFGGISFITVDTYPSFTVERLPSWPVLDALLSVIYLGQPHDSSVVHEEVIEGGDRGVFERLRAAAVDAKNAVEARDLAAFGSAMISNNAAQADLHPGVVGRDALVVIEAAKRLGALGWKVNGAGGDGGSLTVLGASADAKRELDGWVRRIRRYKIVAAATSDDGVRVDARGGLSTG